MARQVVEVNSQVGQLALRVTVVEFPIIEDIISQLIAGAVFSRRIGEPLDTASPIGRDVKDFMIKSNVAGD